MSTWTSERAKIAAITRGIRAGERPADDPKLVEARRNLRALRLEKHVTEVIDGWPPLSEEQCQRIAGRLLAGTNRGGNDAA
jgi:hypothetical protein